MTVLVTPAGNVKAWPLSGQTVTYSREVVEDRNVELVGRLGATEYETMYRTQPWVFTVVNKISKALAKLPLKSYEIDEQTGNRNRLRDHPLPRLLASPWPGGSRYSLVEFVLMQKLVYGNALLVIEQSRRKGEGPVALWPVDWAKVKIMRGKFSPIGSYQYQSGTEKKNWLPDEVLHFRGSSLDGVSGVSPLQPLARTLILEDAAQRASISAFRNGLRPATAYVVPGRLQPAQKQELEARLRLQSTGVDARGGNILLEGGAELKSVAHTAQEAELIMHRKVNREEVAACYSVDPTQIGILDRATFCLPAHVPVFTETGPRPIADVAVGERVWSQAGDRMELRRVTRAGQTGVDPILRIRTQNRTLEANATHPVLVRRTRSVKGTPPEWMTGRRKSAACQYGLEAEHVYVAAGEIRKGDVLVTLAGLPSLSGGARAHPESVEMMEFYGLFLGDGNLMRNGDALAGVAVARAESAAYMDHYRETMRSFTGRGDRPVVLQEQERTTRFSSASAARGMVERGFSGTAHTKRVPGWVFESSEELRLAFLRGYLDADGSVDKKGRISFSSCNQSLLQDIRHLCMGAGVPVTNLYTRTGVSTLPNGRTVSFEQSYFTCSDPGANRRIGSHDPRYQERLEEGQPFGKKLNEYPFGGGTRSVPPAGCGYSKVVAVEHLPAEPVYDIEVEGTHNFVAAGVIVHNSNVEEAHRGFYMDTLGPEATLLEDVFATQLISRYFDYEGTFVEFDFADILKGNLETRFTAYAQALTSGWATRNEIRAKENLPPVDDRGADALYAPLNMVALDGRIPSNSDTPVGTPPLGTVSR